MVGGSKMHTTEMYRLLKILYDGEDKNAANAKAFGADGKRVSSPLKLFKADRANGESDIALSAI
jgi:hypothetical protein